MSIKEGGPAFPYSFYPGMTLRDWFAGQALAGMLGCPLQPQSGPDMYARDAYAMADAMLAAREVKPCA